MRCSAVGAEAEISLLGGVGQMELTSRRQTAAGRPQHRQSADKGWVERRDDEISSWLVWWCVEQTASHVHSAARRWAERQLTMSDGVGDRKGQMEGSLSL